MNLNKVFIIGRITANPELRRTPTGASVTSFSIATNRVWNDKNNAKQEETEFHNVVAWGRQAEVAAQFLVKGSLVLIEGRLRTRSWQDKQGMGRKTTEIVCERLQLGPRPAAGGAREPGMSRQSPDAAVSQHSQEEEIPVIDLEDANGQNSEDIPF